MKRALLILSILFFAAGCSQTPKPNPCVTSQDEATAQGWANLNAHSKAVRQ